MFKLPNIAIDGPAGSGKSSVARITAQRLGFFYVDTGAMYRAMAYLAIKKSININDKETLVHFAGKLRFSYVTYIKTGEISIWCNGEDVTPFLRLPEVSLAVAKIAAVSGVREHLVNYQRLLARSGGVVMEGRDIGTVVLPNAEYKFFITADPDVRFNRRSHQLNENGLKFDEETLRRQFTIRDQVDSKRKASPLRIATGAIIIDSTNLCLEEVIVRILEVYGGEKPGAL